MLALTCLAGALMANASSLQDKHAKQLASKLAHRLTRVESERQWNDVAYALGLLPHKNEEITKLVADGCKVVEAAA